MASPWFTICSTPPVTPCCVNANTPSTTKPRCETDEYATSRLMSVWTSAFTAPYTIPITAITPTKVAKYLDASGNSIRLKRISP